ncbi:hypothetical protein CYLTODRAFT_424664, partial [Cylindrobasidium torrendii FP15055 ss-10]
MSVSHKLQLSPSRSRKSGWMKLPVELKRAITADAIGPIIDNLRDEIDSGKRSGTLAAALYDWIILDVNFIRQTVLESVEITEARLLSSFLREAPALNGVATSIVILNIDCRTMLFCWRWETFVSARKSFLRLRQLALAGVKVGPSEIGLVVKGLDHLSFIDCTIAYATLAIALAGVPSFNASGNKISQRDAQSDEPFVRAFELIELAAATETESGAYAQLLSRVHRVDRLYLRGIKRGWKLGDGGWLHVVKCTCLYGLPSYMVVHPKMAALFIAVSASSLADVLPFIRSDCRADIVVTVDVPFGWSTADLLPLWHVLDMCLDAKSIKVVLNVPSSDGVHLLGDESFAGFVQRLAASNVTGEVVLCPDALLSVVCMDDLDFFRS